MFRPTRLTPKNRFGVPYQTPANAGAVRPKSCPTNWLRWKRVPITASYADRHTNLHGKAHDRTTDRRRSPRERFDPPRQPPRKQHLHACCACFCQTCACLPSNSIIGLAACDASAFRKWQRVWGGVGRPIGAERVRPFKAVAGAGNATQGGARRNARTGEDARATAGWPFGPNNGGRGSSGRSLRPPSQGFSTAPRPVPGPPGPGY